MTRLQEHQHKLRLIEIIQSQLRCSKGFWAKGSLLRQPLPELRKVVSGFCPIIKTVSLDKVLILLDAPHRRLCRIQHSPHYQFLLGNTGSYVEYYKKVISCRKRPSDKPENEYIDFDKINPSNFNRFLYNFTYLDKYHLDSYIRVAKFKDGYYISRDGDHRLAILKTKKIIDLEVSIKLG